MPSPQENHYILERKLLADVTPSSPSSSSLDKVGTTGGASINADGAQQAGASSSPTTNNGHSRDSSLSTASMSTEDDDDEDDD